MSLSAFTQAPGTHSRYESAVGYQYGQWYGWHGREQIYRNPYMAERSSKWYPQHTHGTRHPTTYQRSVEKVTVNRPMITRRFQTEGNPPDDYVVIDLQSEDHITNYHTPFTYETADPGWQNAKDESVVKALNRLAEANANLGASLAEGKRTCDMYLGLVIRGANALHELRRLNWRRALEATGYGSVRKGRKQISDDWLSFIYGWKPLAQEIYDADDLAVSVLKQVHQIEGTAKGKSERHEDFTWSGWLRHRGSSRVSHRTVLRGLVQNKALHYLNAGGLINPASIAWELVPWSFAIDWFMPVGQTLQAMTAHYGVQSQGGWTSSKTDTTLVLDAVTGPVSWHSTRTDGGSYVARIHRFHRQAYADFPRPQFFADTTPFSSTRAINALALVNQLVR